MNTIKIRTEKDCFNLVPPKGRIITVLDPRERIVMLQFQFSPSKRKDYHGVSPFNTGICFMFQFSPSKRKDYHNTCGSPNDAAKKVSI